VRSAFSSLLHAVSTFEQLGSLPPVTAEFDLFGYVPLDSPREPPPVELRARLARRDDDDEDGEGLRLAFVIGHPIDSHDLFVLAYRWRAAPEGVVWGIERWSSPQRRLRPYRHDPTFEPRTAADVHAELRGSGVAGVASSARALLP
jgi:hypothetical protein